MLKKVKINYWGEKQKNSCSKTEKISTGVSKTEDALAKSPLTTLGQKRDQFMATVDEPTPDGLSELRAGGGNVHWP